MVRSGLLREPGATCSAGAARGNSRIRIFALEIRFFARLPKSLRFGLRHHAVMEPRSSLVLGMLQIRSRGDRAGTGRQDYNQPPRPRESPVIARNIGGTGSFAASVYFGVHPSDNQVPLTSQFPYPGSAYVEAIPAPCQLRS
jgi:hypothetical protein